MMDELRRKRIVDRHRDAWLRHGHHPNALYWSGYPIQHGLFDILLGIGVEDGSRVLDFGCGFGDLYGYMRERGIKVDYTGIDLSPELIAAGRERHPEAHFFEGDLFDLDPAAESFDYAFVSGSLNEPMGDEGDYARRTIARLYASCRKALAFNLLDSNNAWVASRFDLQSFDPQQMITWCQGLTPRVERREDYGDKVFTLVAFRP